MSIIQLIEKTVEEVCNEMCNDFCKWPEKWDEKKEGCELMDSEHCKNCPLNKLQ